MSILVRFNEVKPYKTKDGSQIFELMHPAMNSNQNQSLALAVILPGETTSAHIHKKTEEIYYIQSGTGQMTLGSENFEISEGDTICIMPGTSHHVKNTGHEDLKILCCCAPAYSHEDTDLEKI